MRALGARARNGARHRRLDVRTQPVRTVSRLAATRHRALHADRGRKETLPGLGELRARRRVGAVRVERRAVASGRVRAWSTRGRELGIRWIESTRLAVL